MLRPELDQTCDTLLDVETPGLDQRKDEVIELGMVKFDYLPDGRIAGLRDIFSSFNEPSEPIPLDITALTGITNEMVIAHNASFDRKFAERYWPIFQRKARGCSATEVEWRKHGFEGSRLGYLLNGAGLFHQAHRAIDDCHALLEVLALELPTTGTSALAVLLEQARKKTMRVWAEQSPFDLKDSLRRRAIVGATEAMAGQPTAEFDSLWGRGYVTGAHFTRMADTAEAVTMAASRNTWRREGDLSIVRFITTSR